MNATPAPVLNVVDVVELEHRIAASGTTLATLMRRAGQAVADAVQTELGKPGNVCVLAGAGNNGGDGWVAAELLVKNGFDVTLITPKAASSITAEPAHEAAERAVRESGTSQDAADSASGTLHVLVMPNNGVVADAIRHADVVVDALLGTGFSGTKVRPPMDAWIDRANSARSTYRKHIIAVDVPSGLSAQTGSCSDPCIRADETITMMVMKPGLCEHEPKGAQTTTAHLDENANGRPVCVLGGTASTTIEAVAGKVTVAEICDLAPFKDFIDSVALGNTI